MLQDVKERAIPALPGLDWGLADTLAHHLNRDLATLADLAAAYKQAHWNVLGPGFAELHRLFDEFADETRAYVDLVAERTVVLGETAHGTLHATAECTALTPFPVDERDERRLLQELAQRAERTSEELRGTMALSAEEPATQDVCVEIVRAIEKQRWMLLAHLAQRAPMSSSGG
jgi:starvation-inducible DNA-binding protein